MVDYVKLEEYKHDFSAIGCCSISISKPHGSIVGMIPDMPPSEGLIPREGVEGFRVDEKKIPPEIYLDWHGVDEDKRHTLVGRVEDIQEARDWVRKVNKLYD